MGLPRDLQKAESLAKPLGGVGVKCFLLRLLQNFERVSMDEALRGTGELIEVVDARKQESAAAVGGTRMLTRGCGGL